MEISVTWYFFQLTSVKVFTQFFFIFFILTIFIELSTVNKKNVFIKFFEPSERKKYVFVACKARQVSCYYNA